LYLIVNVAYLQMSVLNPQFDLSTVMKRSYDLENVIWVNEPHLDCQLN